MNKRATAYHEAGHAIMNLSLGVRLKRVTIVPAEGFDGTCQSHRVLSRGDIDNLDIKFVSPAGRIRLEKVVDFA